MLLITHSLVGATLATQINNPLLSLPAAFFSHFLMDSIPHWDLGTDFKKRKLITNFYLALADGLVSLLVVFLVWQWQQPFSLTPWLGMGFGLLPDFSEIPYLFFNRHLFVWLDDLHNTVFHRETAKVFWGLLPQVALIVLCLWVAFRSI